ncbi:MAG: hypothetical protein GEU71_09520 [Actinobacteria bacterium]|nr:hypothetical protein [Actinomycetota bacterium]
MQQVTGLPMARDSRCEAAFLSIIGHHLSIIALQSPEKRRCVMAGSIRQRGRNSWQIRVYSGTDPETGQRRQLTRTVRGSRTQAQRELRALAAFANVGPAVGARTTLAELLERWFAANEADWATTTVRSTWSIIERQLKPKLGHVRVRDLTTVMIDEFYALLRVDGAVEGGPLSPGSVQRIHGVLHRALAQAMRWEWIWSNPAASASPPRMEPVEMRPPSPEQVGRLLDHVKARTTRCCISS